jgi:hypothetical protein
LHVATADSVWAFELGQRATEVAAAVGVSSVRFAPGPLPSGTAQASSAAIAEPTAAETLHAAQLASPISDENLRETVQKAIGLGLARRAADRPF